MLRNVLLLLFALVLVVAAVGWVKNGGAQNLAQNASFFSNPFSMFNTTETESGWQLPSYEIPFEIQPITLPEFTEEDGVLISADTRWGDATSHEDIHEVLLDAETEYDRLRAQLADVRTFGDVSPAHGLVYISNVSTGLNESMPSVEYVSIEASSENTAPISLSGWSLQSARSGKRAMIPQGTRLLTAGTIPEITPITLEPGARAIITTGKSPVGVSFRENSCSGYLDQFQSFVPSLDTYSCPLASDELPYTLENAEIYGDACFSFLETLPRCTFYTDSFPADISGQCRNFVQYVMSYNGCVQQNRWRPSFTRKDWRIFLGQPQELWAASRDVIRLLDAQGRTVDAWSY